jgi:hypothetical protein
VISFWPEQFQSNFLVHCHPLDNNSESSASLKIAAVSDEPEDSIAQEDPVTFNDVVRILVSYDTGWSTRGTGQNYDNLNGFGVVIGNLSGMVLDYSTCNRKYKKCGESEKSPERDCRKNFYISVKAVEPHVAKDLWIVPFFNLTTLKLECR